MMFTSIRFLGCAAIAMSLTCGASLAQTAAKHGAHEAHDSASLTQRCQSSFAVPSVDCAKAPMPIFSNDGRLWVSFASRGHIYVSYSDNLGRDFSTPIAVNRIPEPIYGDKENRPKLAFGSKDEIYVSWTRKRKAKYSGEVRFSRSIDGGLNFENPRSLIDPGALSSHRFDSMATDDQGRLYVAWIDKRDKAAADAQGEDYAGGAVYYSVSKDGGKTFSPNKKIVDNSCECCRMRVETDNQGRVHALWRNIYPGSARDNAVAILSGESIIKNATRVSFDEWQVEACPHHGPDISLDRENRLHATWFNGGGKRPGLVYGRFDGAVDKLEHDISIDSSASASHPRVLAMGSTIYVAWKRFVGDATEIRLITSKDYGATWSDYEVIGITENESDQMFLVSDSAHVYLSLRTDDEGYQLIPIGYDQANLEVDANDG